ncbi:uncharacterized protein PAC_05069 [Phialocephala subalpina]|uniref:Extracellular membrane protein CFEM domain-containing protein n=1 Tax=Phialocephala subalpina TaxID=576137 RepID=A0A1L7WQZ1_9HELO|nr:uncharacterized protein PAC_05069 [Phialocephala subalpina]
MGFSSLLMWALLVSASSQNACNQNNCYRAFNGDAYTASAQSYCSKYTAATIASANNIPWASKSCSTAAQISSICSCAYPAGAVVKTTSAIPLATSSAVVTSSSIGPKTTSSTTLSSKSSSKSSSTSQVARTTTIGTPFSAFQTSTSTYKQREFGPGCLANNCLRALDRYNADAFCSVFTYGGMGASGIPSYASPCTRSSMAQVSSACTCLNYYGNTIKQVSTAGTAVILTTTLWIPMISSTIMSSPTIFVSPSSTAISSTVLPGPRTSSPVSSTAAVALINPLTFSTSTIPVLSDSTTSRPAAGVVPLNEYCYANNCLRAMKREGGVGATAFCASFTTALVTNSAALPTYATQCSTNAIAQMSSACTCIGSQAYATS